VKSVLWCEECGRSVAWQPENLLRYAETGWPRCCGEVMSFGRMDARWTEGVGWKTNGGIPEGRAMSQERTA
jgi:hypothetical protein